MTIKRGAIALLAPLMLTAPAPAQTTQTAPVRGLESLQPQANAQAPAATTPIPIPASPTIVLPATRSTQPPATPRERTEPRATPRTEPRTATPEPNRATPRPVETVRPSAPAATPTPVPTPAPTSTPSPAVTPSVAPAPAVEPATPPASTATAPETGRAMPFWLWLLVIVVVLAALWALRRPRPVRPAEPVFEPVAPEPEPEAPIVAASPAPRFLEPRATAPVQAPRARLAVELRPLRAGLNLLSATVECELVVTNIGEAPADRIRVAVALLTAHAGQDADLVAFNESPIGRAVAPPFALAPGETRSVRTVAAIPRDAIRTMAAAGRPMFVPILAANLLYATGDSEGQTARAWAIGIERVDSAKLAPFWLDGPAKMYAAVAARPHAAALER